MRRSRVPSNGPGRLFAAQFSAGCTTNMSGFDFRQAQPGQELVCSEHIVVEPIPKCQAKDGDSILFEFCEWVRPRQRADVSKAESFESLIVTIATNHAFRVRRIDPVVLRSVQ
jgi:hypothetical protein